MMHFDLSHAGLFRGYASIFNSPDLAQDVIMPGAFAHSLHRRGTKRVRMLYQHEAAQPIGVWHRLQEDGQGLLVEGRLLLEVERAHDVWKLMAVGAIDGLSIGFRTIRSSAARMRDVRIVHEIDLVEISIVTFPMHPQARVAGLTAPSTPAQAMLAQNLRFAAKHFTPHRIT